MEKEERRGWSNGDGREGTKRTRKSSISEARLCVNVWLAFGRQPWQIALLGWQPGSLSTRGLHLRAATHRDCTLYSPSPPVSSSSASPSSFNARPQDNVTRGWMNGRTRILAAGGRCFFEIEPNHLTLRCTATATLSRRLCYCSKRENQSIQSFPSPLVKLIYSVFIAERLSFVMFRGLWVIMGTCTYIATNDMICIVQNVKSCAFW